MSSSITIKAVRGISQAYGINLVIPSVVIKGFAKMKTNLYSAAHQLLLLGGDHAPRSQGDRVPFGKRWDERTPLRVPAPLCSFPISSPSFGNQVGGLHRIPWKL